MSSKTVNTVVFLAGLAAVCWIAAGYVGSNPLALCVTLLIGACYLAGTLELQRYSEATVTLTRAVANLSVTPPDLAVWLDPLHPSVRNPVRLRIEGERVALPGPALTPYLVGLLVLLGMLGTLLGMVATLRGTGMALESATDLQAIRDSLAAPVKGLGFAFGTSIAGVATSAMLGLLSALCRRERLLTAQTLDMKIASTLRRYSQAHHREESFRILQRQAELMPTLVDRLQTMMASIEQQNLQLSERQIASQDAFHSRTDATYTRLAASVEQSLKASVAESARTAGAALRPVMEATLAGLARESAALHETVTQAVQRQMDGLSSGFESNTLTVADLWNKALAGHERSSEKLAAHSQQALAAAAATFERHSASLLHGVSQSHADLQTEWASRDQQRLAMWTETLGSMARTLGQQYEQIGTRSATQQRAICDTLEQTAHDISAQAQAHAGATIAEIARLVEAASEAPKAAAGVVAELRQKLSDSMVRDTAMLEERSRLLATLETLLDAVNHASSEQRTAVDALVATSADLLDRVSTRFTDKVGHETEKLGAIAAQVTGSAVEVASLGDAFGAAVHLFGESNDKLVAHLTRIEAALDRSLVRSDEQLAYYVAQAREVIDLSMMSQKQIIEDLQQIAAQRASAGAEAA
jgi:hypothetical protein